MASRWPRRTACTRSKPDAANRCDRYFVYNENGEVISAFVYNENGELILVQLTPEGTASPTEPICCGRPRVTGYGPTMPRSASATSGSSSGPDGPAARPPRSGPVASFDRSARPGPSHRSEPSRFRHGQPRPSTRFACPPLRSGPSGDCHGRRATRPFGRVSLLG